MDIKILDSWLKDYLYTKATPEQIAKYLSLCGPSVERIEKIGNDFVYDIEITTNRIDSVGIYGIAREAAAILPRFNIPAKLKKIKLESKDFTFTKKVNYLEASIDKNLCSRFTAVLIKDVRIGSSPEVVRKRLELVGLRSLNNIVDISNYIALELGQPVHTFDYDKIAGHKMTLRESKKGEIIETLDGKSFILPGGDIVIEDGQGRIIDLAGIMGGNISKVDDKTKNVLLFVQTYNPTKIRKTSMALAQRTMAATIFEKGTDEELVSPAILKGIELFKSLTKGSVSKNILNIYPKPYKVETIEVSLNFINQRLGVNISKKEITQYLSSLEFGCTWSGDKLNVEVSSFRSRDIKYPEDILEEIARIYGYHNLPSQIMTGPIPERPADPKFRLESNVKNIISGFGGTEVYTLSLVPKNYTVEKHLKLKNPLGPETEFLRTSLMPSLMAAAKENNGIVNKFHIFEISNIYLPRVQDLPEERSILAGIFSGYSYRKAKGIVEGILERLGITPTFEAKEAKGFGANKCAFIYCGKKEIGKIGVIEGSELIYYEFEMQKIIEFASKIHPFTPISKYPSQVEDLTIHLPEHTKIGDVINTMTETSSNVEEVTYVGNFKDNHTFHIKYHNSQKTLTNKDVENIRTEIISSLKSKFAASIRE